MNEQKIKEQIEKKEKEISDLKEKLKEEENKSIEPKEVEWIAIPETDYEVTKNVLYKGKSYNEIMQLKKPEEELLTLKLIGIICENPTLLKELKMDSSSTKDDFFFKQPFPQNEKKGYVAEFGSFSDYAGLYCDVGSDFSYSDLGVRFCRKKNSKGKK